MPTAMENRGFAYEYRDDAENPGFSGHFATFLVPDNHGTVFSRRSFAKTVRERGDRIPVLFNHDPDKVIGKATELRADGKGMFFNSKIAEGTMWGREVMTLVRSGMLGGMSFAFRSVKERPGTKEDQIDLTQFRGAKPEEFRFVEEVNLREITAATFPSQERSQITSFRSDDADEYDGIIEELRTLGIEDEKIETLLANIREVRSTTPDENEPLDSTQDVIESRDDDLDLDIDLILMEIHL